MAFQVDHSANLPKEFHICPICGKQGVYILPGDPETLIRCKYCKAEKAVARETWLGKEMEVSLLGYK